MIEAWVCLVDRPGDEGQPVLGPYGSYEEARRRATGTNMVVREYETAGR